MTLTRMETRIRSATTLHRIDLDHQTPEAKIHGMSADISDIYEFEFYEWVMFNESQATFPETKFHVGRWLGPDIVWYRVPTRPQVCTGVCNILWLVPYHTHDKENLQGFVLWIHP